MKDEIKEILKQLQMISYDENSPEIPLDLISRKAEKQLLDYITNLQEKSNNQSEEINRLYKQREKFMKKYGYLKEENERLRKELELCKKNGKI